jgi:hypothetical protein
VAAYSFQAYRKTPSRRIRVGVRTAETARLDRRNENKAETTTRKQNWTENFTTNEGFLRSSVGSMKRTLGGDGWVKFGKELAPGDDFY